MRESEYNANRELTRGAKRTKYTQTYKPAKRESRALAFVLTVAFGAAIGVLLALYL